MSTLCVLTVAFIGVLLILRLCIPFNPLRIALLVVVVAGTVLGAALLPHLFDIAPFTTPMTLLFIPTLALNALAFQLLYRALVPRAGAVGTPRQGLT